MANLVHNPRLAALLLLAGFAGLSPALASAPAVLAVPAVPMAVGAWTGRALPLDNRTAQLLQTRNVALMEYRAGDAQPVWLTQVNGVGNRAAFHPPELCYIGSQFDIVERGPITVPVRGQSRRLMRLVVAQQGHRYEAWYWFTANGRVTANYYLQQLWLAWDTVTGRGRPASGTLVRISTPLDAPAAVRQRLTGFLSEFEAASQPGPRQ